MRYAVLIFALLGALASGFLATKWLGDLSNLERTMQITNSFEGANNDIAVELKNYRNAGYALVAAALAGLAGGVLAMLRKGRIAAPLMIVAGLAPALFQTEALIFSGIVVFAGLLAIFVRPQPKTSVVAVPGAVAGS